MTETTKELTPMMKQWHACKKDAGSALLLFRLGDFYEAFFDDAEQLASTVMITLTKRGETPMAGIPVRSIEGYLEKLIDSGLSVALAEQLESPEDAIGIVERKVTRIVTPATFTSSGNQNSGTNNFLLSLSVLNKSYAISYTDTSTSEFFFSSFPSAEQMIEEIIRIHPKEILVSAKDPNSIKPILSEIKTKIISIDPFYFDHKMCLDKLYKHLKVASLDGFGLRGELSAIQSCGALLSYLENDLFMDVSIITSIKKRDTSKFLTLDHSALSHLEIFHSPSGQSLFHIINFTKTPMGERLLKTSLFYPLICSDQIIKRQNCVKELLEKSIDLSNALSGIKDIERLITKIAGGKANPADLFFLASSLDKIPAIIQELAGTLLPITASFSPLPLIDAILQTIVLNNSEYFISEGINNELDALKHLERTSEEHLKAYEERCRADLGIRTLKVAHSRSFGYFIEVSKKSVHLVPDSFIRKQTMVNGERFITEELRQLESEILSAKEGALKLEQTILFDLIELCISHQSDVLKAAALIAKIDLIHSFKVKALSRGYICPEVTDTNDITIEEGSHPILLKMMRQDRFIPNDILLNKEKSLAILTGPNMAGKSTYIKSVALLVILTQIGCFIPAKSATLGVVDKIFTRIGALDDLQRGQSTFMVEMTETANILRNASEKSLIILDEIGRGTSTYDGIALAKSIAMYIANEIGAKTLFATHYLELTDLANDQPNIKNIRSTVLEKGDEITFLHKIEEGEANKSYGIFVGQLAGLPKQVITAAKNHLTSLSNSPLKKSDTSQYTMFIEEKIDPLKQALEALDVNNLTPFEALEKLMQWKKTLL